MQLFEHTHQILRDCAASLREGPKEVGSDGFVYVESQLVLQPAVGIEDSTDRVRIKVKKRRGESAPDWKKVSDGARDFCGEVLGFAFNPVEGGEPRYKDNHEAVKVQSGDLPHSVSLSGPEDQLSGKPLSEAVGQISRIEQLMFADWSSNGHPTIVEKKFDSEEEASRVMHLLALMAEAFGMKEKTVEKAFHEPPDGATIRIDRKFLQTLVKREQTLEANLGREDL